MLFLAFITTWLITRTITRSIRAGRGHLHDVSAGGVHLHHSIPGIVLLTTGAVAAVGLPATQPWRVLAAVLVGVGASLVFDEFAMILHLEDDYWQAEGRQSVEAVGLVAACLALGLVGFSPFGVDDATADEVWARAVTAGLVACTMVAVAAVRLARPGSRWDVRRYASVPRKRDRAAVRAAAFDRRWDPRWRRLADALAGRPGDASGTEVGGT